MAIKSEAKQLKLLTGNAAAAYAVRLCRPNVIAGYPITPQTELWDVLYRFLADGSLKCEAVEPEGEHSVMSILIGASAAGARTFTATAAQGLFLMFEPYISAANQRLPMVMVNANREIQPPGTISGSGQDILLVKETGWIQIHTETCQEVLDTIIMAYRLTEDPEILVPVTVAYDGYYLSYFSEGVNIPAQEEVDRFLPRLERFPRLDPDIPMSAGIGGPNTFVEYRIKHMEALQRSKKRIEEIEKEFEQAFGRSYGGQIEEYRCEDAEIVLVTMGSATGTAKVIVDRKREQGMKLGLIKIRMFRPFPQERLVKALSGKKAIGTLDRNVCFGWNCGHLMMELRSALASTPEGSVPILDFIDGLNGRDIILEHVERAVDAIHQAAQGGSWEAVTFLELE